MAEELMGDLLGGLVGGLGPVRARSGASGVRVDEDHLLLDTDGAWLPRGHRRITSEARRLAVLAPLLAQGVADLAERGLRAARLEHRGDHVGVLPGRGEHRLDGARDLRLVT